MALGPVLHGEAGDWRGALRARIAPGGWRDLLGRFCALPTLRCRGGLRATITGKRGVFDYAKRLAGYGRDSDQKLSEEAKAKTPPVTHALVRAHPETGERSALHLDLTTTIGIDYMDTASGLALLDEVYDSATRDEFVYAHRWQVGDLVVWDNGFTMHRRSPFDPGDRRLMKRMTMNLDRHHHVMPDGKLAVSEVGNADLANRAKI